VDHIGTGGMAHIYRAKDRNLLRQVAIKVLREDLIEDPDFQAKFTYEARLAANLTHPNIVTIFDFGFDQGKYFIVMEYISGMDLKSLIRSRGTIDVDEAVKMMIQISRGVGYAHRAGLIHCDLKPQNILRTNDGQMKITDFGIARALSTIRSDEHAEVVWGSPTYFSPEQAAGEPPSPASDVYSLGVILFEMLTGQPPFHSQDGTALGIHHQITPPPLPRNLKPSIPSNLEQMILKVLSKEPSARYRTADQFSHVLDNLAFPTEVQPELATAQTYQQESNNKRLSLVQIDQVDWIAIALGLVAFIAIGGLIPLWLWVCLRYPACPLSSW
jgi:serine/threonine-protein kinase